MRARGTAWRPAPGPLRSLGAQAAGQEAAGWRAVARHSPGLCLTALLLVVAVVHVVVYPGLLGADPPMFGPQENVRLELAQQWVTEGQPTRELERPRGLVGDAQHALTPRDAALQGGAVVPKDFPFAVALTALLLLVDPRLAAALSTISALALLLVVALLARRLGGRWSGVTAAAVLATTGAFTAGTSGPLNTSATAATVLVAAVLLLLPARPALPGAPFLAPSPLRDVMAGVLLGVGANLRHDLVLLAAGLLVALVLTSPRGAVRACRVAIGGLVALVPGLIYYDWLHGSPFTTGYAVGARALAVPGEPHFELLTLNAGMLLEHLGHYVARPEVVLLVACALLASGARRSSVGAPLALGLVLGGVAYLVFVGARPLYGVDEFTLGASFLRYALPVVALLLCLCTANRQSEPAATRRTRGVLLALSALVGLVLAVTSPGGLLDQRRQVLQNAQLRAQVLEVTEPDAVVVTARGDKVLWPRRTTITAAYLIRKPMDGLRYGSITYDVVPEPRRLAEVVAGLTHAGEQVYVLGDAFPPYWDGLDLELRLAGVQRVPTAARSLFKITAASP